jgi:methionyl-tRNA formyltransferase
MGTPDFAATILTRLLTWEGGEVVGVYTQPDRPCGRGRVCKPSAVKQVALEQGLPVFQPVNFKDEADRSELADLQPDLLVVAAYGLILPQSVLDIPGLGAVNVHASLLPKYRGAAPIQRVIMDGEQVTGITIMQMEAGLDSGPMLLQRALAIGMDDTAASLHDELADMGGRLLVEALDRMAQGTLKPIEQDHDRATYAPKLEKKEGLIDWNRPAGEIHDRIRGLYPWPGSWFDWDAIPGKPVRLTLFPGRVGRERTADEVPGTILGEEEGSLAIACADRIYLLPRVKPASGKPMDAKAFLCGYMSRCE